MEKILSEVVLDEELLKRLHRHLINNINKLYTTECQDVHRFDR